MILIAVFFVLLIGGYFAFDAYRDNREDARFVCELTYGPRADC